MRALGYRPMPWQEQVVMVGGELLEDGTPAYREVVYTPPRQSGKTTVWLGVAVHRALGWTERLGQPQRIAYSAQTGNDARTKLLDDHVPVLERNRVKLGLGKVTRANGNESVSWRNGSKLVCLNSSIDSGHGQTFDCGGVDELFADRDLRREQALVPAMATRPHAQKWLCSTAGTLESIAWNAAVERGRAAVLADKREGTCYLEWSADSDDDPYDPAVWASCMPALGYTINERVVRDALATMELGEFKRAFLNIPTMVLEQIIPAAAWNLVNDPNVEATAAAFALDIDPDRSAACFVAAGKGPTIEVAKYGAGVGWVIDFGLHLWERYRAPIVIGSTGPAAGFADELERQSVKVIRLSARDEANAAGRFYDRVVTEAVKIRRHPDLDAAVKAAAKRESGDSWAWSRKKASADISPLVAASNALAHVDRMSVAANVW